MFRRTLALAGLACAALALAGPALAVRVHVRVEGAKTTIYGAAEPALTPVTGTFTPPDGPPVTVAGSTPLGALERASRKGEFAYRVAEFAFGPYVDRIGRRAAGGATGWVFKVNGASPPVGADKYQLKEGDRVLWYFARFGPTGGPQTLDLVLAASSGEGRCYGVVAQDDAGKERRVRDVVFHVDGRRVASASGRACVRRHWHRLRATKRGFVRSPLVTPSTKPRFAE